MAKVNISYDTVEKTAEVTIDGKYVDNLYSIGVYCNYVESGEKPTFCFEMSSVELDNENKLTKVNRVMASLKKPETDVAQQIRHRLFSSA